MNILKPIPENIPAELKDLKQWVCWKLELVKNKKTGKEKFTKVPYTPHAGKQKIKASSTGRSTWRTFDQALTVYKDRLFDGIGFVLAYDDPFVGVDLDHCINEDGTIEPWARAIVDKLNSYTEKSPSGTGIHIFIKGKLPRGERKKGAFECYDSGRYLTVTGVPL